MKGMFKKSVSLLVATGIMATMIPAGLRASATPPASTALPVTLSKTATALVGTTNEWTINLSAAGSNSSTTTTSDIVLVLDRSGSMNGSMSNVLNNANTLVDTVLTSAYTRVALVSFSDNASTDAGFTSYTDKSSLKTKISSLSAGGGTNTQDGIYHAEQLLSTSTATHKYIILLSDGEPTYSYQGTAATGYSGWIGQSGVTKHNFRITSFDRTHRIGYGGNFYTSGYGIDNYNYWVTDHGIGTMSEAYLAKAAGATIYTIGYNGGSGNIAQYVLKNVASDAGKFYVASGTDVSTAFASIAGNIQSFYSATASYVTDPIGANFDLVADSITASPGTTATYDDATRTITWQTGTIADATPLTLSYRVRLKARAADGLSDTNGPTILHYTDSTGTTTSQNFDVPQAGLMTVPVNYVDKASGAVLATDSVRAQIGTAYAVPSKAINGYVYDSTSDPNSGVIPSTAPGTVTVYYNKGSFGYTVKYSYDGTIDNTKTVTGTGTFGNAIPSTAKPVDGYVLNSITNQGGKITSDAAANVIVYNYAKGAFGYTVKYSYDGTVDNTKTATGTGTFGDAIPSAGKPIDGYVLHDITNQGGKITSDAAKNVIVYNYVKGSFGYTVEYSYGGTIDSAKTVTGTGTFGDPIPNAAKPLDGYVLNSITNENGKVTSDATKNVIVYNYVKGTFGYTVKYSYDGTVDNTKTVTGTGTFGDAIPSAGKPIDGYVLHDITNEGGTITSDATKNVIVYNYVKGSFGYTVKYSYDGTIDNTKTATGTGTFGDTIPSTGKPVDGYVLHDITNEGGKITSDATKNVIVYNYVIGSFGYTVEYNYGGTIDSTKTVSNTGTFGNLIPSSEKPVDGYVLHDITNAGGKITSDATKNVIVYNYVKGTFGYSVKYSYDGTIDNTKTATGTGTFGDAIPSAGKPIDGYVLHDITNESGTITSDSSKNVIVYNYVKGSFGYTVEYSYDGSVDNGKTVTGTETFGNAIPHDGKPVDGYILSGITNENGTITSDATKNVIVYNYVKGSFGYTVEYTYDGTVDNTKTVSSAGTFGDAIPSTGKPVDGYILHDITNAGGTITSDATKNVIVYNYVKGSFGYTVEYTYDGTVDNTKTVTGTGTFDDAIPSTGKPVNGYILSGITNAGGKITSDATNNVIVYNYVKGSFGYTVEYSYDGTVDSAKTVTGTGTFGDAIPSDAQPVDGYILTGITNQGGTVTSDATKNVITYNYVKGTFGYTVEYSYDGTVDSNKTVTGTGTFGDAIPSTGKPIDGYVLSGITNEGGTVTSDATKNVIVYNYIKGSFGYTVEYSYDGTVDSDKTVTGTGTFGDAIPSTGKPIDGYVLSGITNESGTVTSDATKNVIVYNYVKGTFGYTVEYSYDGTVDSNKTVTGTGTFGDAIPSTGKPVNGYVLSGITNQSGIITSDATKNVIVYNYVKGSFAYSVNYHLPSGAANSNGTAVYGTTQSADLTKTPTGYSIAKVTVNGTAIKADNKGSYNMTISSGDNVMDVYYQINSYDYTVRYLVAGTNEVLMPETTGTAAFGSPVTATAKTMDGYTPDAATKTLASIATEGNVITFYYGIDIPDIPTPQSTATTITVHYYLKDTTTSVADDLSEIGIVGKSFTEKAKTIDGYTLASDSSVTISSLAANSNVVTFYYTKNSTPAVVTPTVTIPDNATPLAASANPKTSDSSTQIPFYAALASLFTVVGVGIERKARKSRKHS